MAVKVNDLPEESPIDRLVKGWEQKIDWEIKKNWGSSNTFPDKRLEVELFNYFEQEETVQPQILQRLKDLYEQAGWKVEIVDKGFRRIFGLGAFQHKYYIALSKR